MPADGSSDGGTTSLGCGNVFDLFIKNNLQTHHENLGDIKACPMLHRHPD